MTTALEKDEQAAQPSVAFGAALFVVAAFLLIFAFRIEDAALTGNSDPGPRMLPIFLSGCLLLGSLVELVLAVRQRSTNKNGLRATPKDTGFWNLLFLLTALIGCVGAMPWLGFQKCAFAFSVALLKRLGATWKSSVLASLGIVLFIVVLFGELFHVQLPPGPYDVPADFFATAMRRLIRAF